MISDHGQTNIKIFTVHLLLLKMKRGLFASQLTHCCCSLLTYHVECAFVFKQAAFMLHPDSDAAC